MAYSEQGTAVSAAIGLILWGVVGAAAVFAGIDGGANIRAGILAMLALVFSIAAAGSLATNARTSSAKAVGYACVAGWVRCLAASVTGVVGPAVVLGLGGISVALLVACFVLALRLPGQRRP